MKKFLKRLFLVLLVIFIIIQFFRPTKNLSSVMGDNDISKKYPVPAEVAGILKTSCYDCHSNNTVYPWYSYIQPVAWWLNNHIKEGKRELDFSSFCSYPIGKQYRKLDEIAKQVKADEMPLSSYLIIHKNAKLSDQQKQVLSAWVQNLRDSIKASYPADSLVRKPQAK